VLETRGSEVEYIEVPPSRAQYAYVEYEPRGGDVEVT